MQAWRSIVRAGLVLAVATGMTAGVCNAQPLDWSTEFGIPGKGVNGNIYAFKKITAPQGELLYAVGSFTQAGGVEATNVAAWNGTEWSAVGVWPFGGTVRAIEVYDDGTGPAIYVGGTFSNEPSETVKNLAKWNGTAWEGVGGGVAGSVYALKAFTHGGAQALYVAGQLTQAGGQATDLIAAWTPTGWVRWFSTPNFDGRISLGYDAARSQTVMLGAQSLGFGSVCETWLWNGVSWTRSAAAGPAGRQRASMAFDSIRGRLLMMGGVWAGGSAEVRNTLWAWDGVQWTSLGPAPEAMTASRDQGMAFDPVRDCLVVYGGGTSNNLVTSQTWEWNELGWHLRTPANSPGERAAASMAFDPVRQKIVLFGGTTDQNPPGYQTWEWDGINWMVRATTGPTPRVGAAMGHDAAMSRLVMAQGAGPGNPSDVWGWNGTQWSQLAPWDGLNQGGDPVVFDSARREFVYGPAQFVRTPEDVRWRAVPQGGLSGPQAYCTSLEVFDDGSGPRLFAAGTFRYGSGAMVDGVAILQGNAWVRAGAANRQDATLFRVESGPQAGLWAYGSFGCCDFLRRWNGSDWQALSVPGQRVIGTRFFAADLGMGERIYAIGHLQENGGESGSTLLEFDGTKWLTVGYREPGPRYKGAMAYDSIRRRAVLFGGTSNGSATGALADTEEFDGRTWTKVNVPGPSARHQHAMDFEVARGVCVVVGGQGPSGIVDGQTWNYDGAAWMLAAESIGGGGRYGHAVAYDTLRQKLVMFGGRDETGAWRGDTWEWDGSAWTHVATSGPTARINHAMAYDQVGGRVVMIAGRGDGNVMFQDAWAWNGTQWTPLENVPVHRENLNLIFDVTKMKVTVYGPSDAASLAPNGQWASVPSWGYTLPSYNGRAGAYLSHLNMLIFEGGAVPDVTSMPRATAQTRCRTTDVGFRDATIQLDSVFAGVSYGVGAQRRLFLADSLYQPASEGVSVFGMPSEAPTITLNPVDAVGTVAQEVVFTVAAIGSPVLAYQWSLNGVRIRDDGVYMGANTNTLRLLSAWSYSNVGYYRCTVISPFGQAQSAAASFSAQNMGPSGPVSLTEIAYGSEVVNVGAGVTLSAFQTGVISDTGQVSFTARSSEQSRIGWAVGRWNDDVISLLARPGQNLPGIEASATVDVPSLLDMGSGGGSTVFQSTLLGPPTPANRTGIWVDDGESQQLVARHGSSAAGTNGVYNSSSAFVVRSSASGKVVYIASLSGGSVTPATNQGVWTWEPVTGQTLVQRTGQIAPGGSTPFTNFDGIKIADNGTLALWARAGGVFGLWHGLPGALQRVVMTGDPAPGFPEGTTIEIIGDFTLAPDGELYCSVVTSIPFTWGLYALREDGLVLLTKTGDQAPGAQPTQTLRTLIPIDANRESQLLFGTMIADDVDAFQGLFVVQPGGAIVPVLLETDPVPPGVVSQFTQCGVRYNGAINDLGQVVFGGTVSNGTTQHPAVFGWTLPAGSFAIAAPGHQVEIMPGIYRTVSQVAIDGYSFGSSAPASSRCLNQSGQLVLTMAFTDDTSGLFLGMFGSFLTAAHSCPTFAVAPRDTTVRVGRTAVLRAQAAGVAPLVFQWTKDGGLVTNNARRTGATTPNLTIQNVALADAGVYALHVSNPCDEIAVAEASLRVLCPADLDDGHEAGSPDDAVSIDDLLYFLVAFEEGAEGADLDNGTGMGTRDEAVTVEDLLYFLVHFEMGC
jgi:Immunoglobulin I-set domain